jgi:hypothetical protein
MLGMCLLAGMRTIDRVFTIADDLADAFDELSLVDLAAVILPHNQITLSKI